MEKIIYAFCILCLLTAFYVGRKGVGYAMALVIPMILWVPPSVRFTLGINLNIFNLSILVITLCAISTHKRKSARGSVLSQTLISFFVYIFIVAFIFYEAQNGFMEYIQNMILFTFEYGVLIYTLKDVDISSNEIKIFNYSVLVTSCVIIIYGIVVYKIGMNPYSYFISIMTNEPDTPNSFMLEERGIIKGRISSTFNHPLQLGQISLLLFTYVFYQMKDWLPKILWFLFLGGLFIMIFLCGSRSSIFPLVVVLAYYYRFMSIRKLMKYLFFCCFLLFVGFTQLNHDTQNTIKAMVMVWDTEAADKIGIHGSSSDSRLNQLYYVFDIVGSNVLLGKGEGYVRRYGSNHPEMVGYESIFLRGLVDWGLIGLLLFLILYNKLHLFLLSQCKSRFDKSQASGLTIPFFISGLLTGFNYSSFGIFLIFYFIVINAIKNRNTTLRKSDVIFIK